MLSKLPVPKIISWLTSIHFRFRSINTESNAFKTKIAPIVGALTLLKTVGFEKDEDGKLKYSGYVY